MSKSNQTSYCGGRLSYNDTPERRWPYLITAWAGISQAMFNIGGQKSYLGPTSDKMICIKINNTENRKGNQEWKFQRYMSTRGRVKTKKNTQYRKLTRLATWTPSKTLRVSPGSHEG